MRTGLVTTKLPVYMAWPNIAFEFIYLCRLQEPAFDWLTAQHAGFLIKNGYYSMWLLIPLNGGGASLFNGRIELAAMYCFPECLILPLSASTKRHRQSQNLRPTKLPTIMSCVRFCWAMLTIVLGFNAG